MRQRAQTATGQPHDTAPLRVVVVGAGFGGVAALRALSRRLPGRVQITVVDRSNHHTFQPLLYQVATAALHPQDVGHNIRALCSRHGGMRFRLGNVTGVDWDRRVLQLDDGGTLEFDRLVLAAGAVTNDYAIPGVAAHAFPLKEIADAVTLRNHILRRFECASLDPAAIEQGALTFVVAGGGPTGVELAGAVGELVHRVLREDFPDLDVSRTRIVLVERAPALLASFSERSQRYALERLGRLGVEVRLGATIVEVGREQVSFADGSTLPAGTLVWAAGVRPHPLAEALGLELEGGRVPVDASLRIRGRPEAFAIGDVAAAPAEVGGPHPQVAPVAMQQGRHVADELAAELDGRPSRPFRYRDKGTMATIGRNAAVAELPRRLRFRGFPAWVAWLALHLAFLVGARNRASVLLTWAWSYVTRDRGARALFEARPAPTGACGATPGAGHPEAA